MTVDHAELMSVGIDEVVVTFVSEPGLRVTTRVGDHTVETMGPFHHARIVGLAPDTDYELTVDGASPDQWLPSQVQTLARPPGELLATVATANDVHFGETECGRTGDPATDAIGPVLSVPSGARPYPEVMNGAVIAEMIELDPDAIVVKGDLTDRGLREQYDAFLRAYGALGTRMHHVRGNHDAIVDPELARQRAPYSVELPGVTLAVLDTAVPHTVGGALPPHQLAWLDALAAATTDPVLVFGHHPVWNLDEPVRSDANYAIALDDSVAFADLVGRRANIGGYFAGHTHSNRVFRFARARRVPFVEVACTKDYPGAWAEYRIYEGGYTQVMRRVSEPDAFAWSEMARTMIQGIYRDLVLGPIEARCFTHLF
jgi:predicted phosphodiesterase